MRPSAVTRRRLVAAAKLAVACGLIAVITTAVDGREAVRLIARADWAWLGAAFLALTLQTLLSALRWKLTAARLEHPLPLLRAVREYYLSQILNQTLPGGMVGDAGRAFRARDGAGLRLSSLAVALERLSGQLGMVAIMAAGLLAALVVPGGLAPPVWLVASVFAICGGLVVTALMVLGAGWLPGALGRGAGALVLRVREAVLAPGVLHWQIVLSVGTALCNLAAFAFCARATGTALPAGAVTVLIPLVLFAMLIPVSVSGWGLREGAAAALFPLAGATGAQGLAASVAFGLVFLVAVLPGLWPLLAKQRLVAHSAGTGTGTGTGKGAGKGIGTGKGAGKGKGIGTGKGARARAQASQNPAQRL